jgi:ATP-dependent DNA ligase
MAIRSGIQLALPFEERRILNQGRFQAHWSPPYLLQPKLNGERCRMLVENGRCLLLSSSEDIIPAVPHINDQGTHLLDGEYDGELYVHGWTWAEIHGVVSREVNMHPRSHEMQLHLFDIIIDLPQVMRLHELKIRLSNNTPHIKYVPSRIATSLTQVYSIYDEFISEGFEGFIIRHMDAPYMRRRSPFMMKFKPKQLDHYKIIGLEEAISEDGTPKGMLGVFQCIDDMGTKFKVGAGKLTHFERLEIWQDYIKSPCILPGNVLQVEYQTKSDKEHVPLFARAVKLI